jgi:hypothetical protein
MPEYVVTDKPHLPNHMRILDAGTKKSKIDWTYRIEDADAFATPELALAAYEDAKAKQTNQGLALLAKAHARGAIHPPLPADWITASRLRADGRRYTVAPAAHALCRIRSISSAPDPLAFFLPKWLSDLSLGHTQGFGIGVAVRSGQVDARSDFDVFYVKRSGKWMGPALWTGTTLCF